MKVFYTAPENALNIAKYSPCNTCLAYGILASGRYALLNCAIDSLAAFWDRIIDVFDAYEDMESAFYVEQYNRRA